METIYAHWALEQKITRKLLKPPKTNTKKEPIQFITNTNVNHYYNYYSQVFHVQVTYTLASMCD
jgi:hypothetical protein